MKILLNATNLVKGGALQVALSVIEEFSRLLSKDSVVLVCSQAVINELKRSKIKVEFDSYVFSDSPARIITRKTVRSRLSSIEFKFNPDIVFTIFGPSYWKPKAIHVCGFADGWCYYPNSPAFQKLSLWKRLKMTLIVKYKLFLLKKTASHFIIETEDAKQHFAKESGINLSNISVVGNSYNKLIYENFSQDSNIYSEKINKDTSFKFVTISAYYPHKNLDILIEIDKILPRNIRISFYLTIPEEDFQKNFFYCSSRVKNLGPISVYDCPLVYSNCDAVFIPTLLETFSANFPEAMVMRKPILTTNLSFSTSICQNAALYFNPDDIEDAVEKICILAKDIKLRELLVNRGLERLAFFTSSSDRAVEYLSILKTFI